MPQQQEEFQSSVAQILEAVMFENWLRFYFIEERPDNAAGEEGEVPLFMAVPGKGMDRIKELYPRFFPLAEEMNERLVDFETSRRAVCTFVLEHLEGAAVPRDTAGSILESAAFQVRLQLFNTWVQLHENQLDQDVLEFGAWRTLFAQWLETPAAREFAARLSGPVCEDASDATQ